MLQVAVKQLIWRFAPPLFQWLSKSYEGQCFSISIFDGDRLDELGPHSDIPCPAITKEDVTDVPALFVADPFMIHNEGQWYMFFEVLEGIRRQGQIGVAFSHDLRAWQYREIVLREPFHLAYPYVFEHDGEIYMIPDSPGNGIRLYKASEFPSSWSLVKEIRTDNLYCDSSIVEHDDCWWLFTAWAPDRSSPKNLRLFFADRPDGEWIEHPASPVESGNQKIVRPSGRIIKGNSDRMYRFAQDGRRVYGESVRAIEILQLNKSAYREKIIEKPILGPGVDQWRHGGMHHIDVHCIDDKLICCVDGWQRV